jgi:hypothetical protein
MGRVREDRARRRTETAPPAGGVAVMAPPQRLLALQRSAGNRAVAGMLMRVGTKLTSSALNSLINVDDNLLDEGSRLLKSLNRPGTVNTGGNDKYTNCALTTLAAIDAGRTSGTVAQHMRESQGLTTHSTGEQSHRVWAMTLEDKATLAEMNAVQPADEARSAGTMKGLDQLSEPNMQVIGGAQYAGLLQYLRNLAGEEAQSRGGNVRFKVYECGEPGNAMFPEADLKAKMAGYPNGTRFAVFVHSNDPTAQVGAHWVYAERFNGQTIFRDYQPNMPGLGRGAAAKDPGFYLDGFPFSPKEATKTFEDGSFLALMPVFGGVEPQIAHGTEVDEARIAGALAEVESYRRALTGPLEQTDRRMPHQWPGLWGGAALSEAPAPSLVAQAYQGLAADLGVTVTPGLNFTAPGVVQFVGSPVHGTGTYKHVMSNAERTETLHPTELVDFPNVNTSMNIVRPGQPAAADATELPAHNRSKREDAYREAAATAYQIDAQTTERSIILNTSTAAFTDLIHEMAHAHEGGTLPMHLREGLAEIFASMASRRLETQGGGDARFKFAFNGTYATYTAATQELVAQLGLQRLATVYFAAKSPKAALQTVVRDATGQSDVQAKAITDKLLSETFPADFRTGLADLGAANADPGAPTVAEPAYQQHKTTFGAYLDQKVTEYQQSYGRTAGVNPDAIAKGAFVEQNDPIMRLERRLVIFYGHKSHVTGAQYLDLMKLVDEHEKALVTATGQTRKAIRDRLLPQGRITFETHYGTRPGQEVYVSGEAPELGEWDPDDAVKLNYRDGGVWEGDVPFALTGGPLLYKYFVRENGAVTWETASRGEHHTRVLPSAGGARFKDDWGKVRG